MICQVSFKVLRHRDAESAGVRTEKLRLVGARNLRGSGGAHGASWGLAAARTLTEALLESRVGHSTPTPPWIQSDAILRSEATMFGLCRRVCAQCISDCVKFGSL